MFVRFNKSRVTFIISPSGHPLFLIKWIQFDFSIFTLRGLLLDPHGVIAGDAVLLFRALEESTPC